MPKHFELDELHQILERLPTGAEVHQLGEVSCKKECFPLIAVTLGSQDPKAPSLGFFGGVHGLERIGSRVCLSHLSTITELARWDESIQTALQHTRLVFFPVVNPGGMFQGTRSNPNGVDLMRNAPVEADRAKPYFLAAGHRISNRLPWYRGVEGKPMEAEAAAVCDVVHRFLLTSTTSLSVDIHSGYGAMDRLWFPYARTHKPFGHLGEVWAIKQILDETFPSHIYRVEPQSTEYTTHGDLWDHLYDLAPKQNCFVPLCLEMGSWNWVKKNPTQLFTALGAFNPVLAHRQKRTLRRHWPLFDFLHRITGVPKLWSGLSNDTKATYARFAREKWYAGKN